MEPEGKQGWRWTVVAFAFCTLGVAVTWCAAEPGFEPLFAVLGGEGVLAVIAYFSLRNSRFQKYLDQTIAALIILLTVLAIIALPAINRGREADQSEAIANQSRPTSTPTSTETPTATVAPEPTATPTGTPDPIFSRDVVLLIDGSRSMDDNGLITEVIQPFVENVFYETQQAQWGARIGVAMFDDNAPLIQELTNNYSVADGVSQSVWGGGGNQIHKGLQTAYDELIKNGSSGADKFLIVVSDGMHPYDPLDDRPYNPSDLADVEQIASIVKSGGVKLCVIAIPADRVPASDKDLFRQIVNSSNYYFEANTAEELLHSVLEILAQ